MRTTKVLISPESLTPQRKHRKLLKDGSSEVWPEQIERIFVQGLREYWESPWATYSRGRSRWRNQFLVEYLQRAGIDRSKKQVASHIQVLRNMWKGESEYHLVAGGEELFLDTTLLPPVKAEGLTDSHLLLSMRLDEHSPVSDHSVRSVSSSTSPSIFPRPTPTVGSNLEPTLSTYPTSRIQTSNDDRRRMRSMSASEMSSNDHRRLSPSFWTPDISARSIPNVPYTATRPDPEMNRGYERLNHQHMPTAHQAFPALRVFLSDSHRLHNSSSLFSSTVPVSRPPIFKQLSLWAEGMHPAAVPVEALSSPAQPTDLDASVVALRIKLHLPPMDAPYPPTLHGFQGSITCNAPRTSSIRCFTAVFVRNQCVSRENSYCSVIATDFSGHEALDNIALFLPDSELSRCRWLVPHIQACIVQKIIVGEQLLAIICYDLDRGQSDGVPSAELAGFQKIASHAHNTQALPTSIPSYTDTPGHRIPLTVHPAPNPLAHELTPPIVNSPTQSGLYDESSYMVSS